MARIAVRGTAQREILPERAKVLLGVSVSGEDRAEVLAEAQRVHAQLVAATTSLVAAGKATDWTALEIQAWSYQEWVPLAGFPGQNEQVRRFRAAGDISVEFADFDEMGLFLAQVAEWPNAEVRGVEWALTPATLATVGETVRAEAVRDAVTHAMEYSTALGLDELTLHKLYEPGLYPGERPEMYPTVRRGLEFAPLAAAGAGAPAFELKPAIVPVTAEVTAVFKTARS